MTNILHNHPHYDACSLDSGSESSESDFSSSETSAEKSPEPKILTLVTGARQTICTANVETPVFTVPIRASRPFNRLIVAAADTGANIDCVNYVVGMKLAKYIERDRQSFEVRTGSGRIKCREYLPVYVDKNEKIIKLKFYLVWDLPFDWLVGRSTLEHLDLTKTLGTGSFIHHREVIDATDDLLPRDDDHYPVQGKNSEAVAEENLDFGESNKIKQFVTRAIGKNAKLSHIRAENEFDTGKITQYPFRITFKSDADTTPIKCAEYPHSVQHIAEIERQLKHLLDIGFISLSSSPWRAPTFVVPKKNGESRIVFDYRRLNAITEKMANPLMSIEMLCNRFKNKTHITTLDLKSGYWHIPVAPEDREKLAFAFNGVLYHWNVMPFGPSNAPPHFQRVMTEIFGDMPYVSTYLDDVVILSESEDEHLEHLQRVFERLERYKLKIRADKCAWGKSSVEYLGWLINADGIKPTERYKAKIQKFPVPTNKKQLSRFIGMVNYLHRHIGCLHELLKPLYEVVNLGKKSRFVWPRECQTAFEEIKRRICNFDNFLLLPDLNKEFSVYCDASINGVGCVLTQKVKVEAKSSSESSTKTHCPTALPKSKTVEVDRPVQFCSKLFNKTQRNWHVSEQEIFAVIYALEKWRPYLIGKRFRVYTDHKNLQELFNRAKDFKAGKLYRWAVRIQDFDFEAKYIEGKKNIFADYLSRDALQSIIDRKKRANTSDILACYVRHLAYESCINRRIVFGKSPHCKQSNSSFFILDRRPVHETPLSISVNKSTLVPMNPDIVADVTSNSESDHESDNEVVKGIHHPRDNHNHNRNHNANPNHNHAQTLPNSDDPAPSQAAYHFQPNHSPSTQPTATQPNNSHNYPTRYKDRQLEQRQQAADMAQPLEIAPEWDEEAFENTEHNRAIGRNDLIMQRKKKANKVTDYSKNFIPNRRPINDRYDMEHIRNSEIRRRQHEDPLLLAVIKLLDKDNPFDITQAAPLFQYRSVLTGRYYLARNKLLMYRYKERNCVVVPAPLRYSTLCWAHTQLHHGQDKTARKLSTRYWWPKFREDVVAFCQVCHQCQQVKTDKTSAHRRGKLQTFDASAPFDLVSIDIVGPLPMTSKNERYIVSVIDKFTRYCMLIPVCDIRANTIVKAFEKWASVFGHPRRLLSDNGAQFISEIFRNYCSIIGTKNTYASPYWPQCNGQVERLHRWIKQRLCLIAVDCGLNFRNGTEDWSDYLPMITHSYNSTSNTMTGYSPNHLLFGRDLPLKIDAINNIELSPRAPEEYLRETNARREIVLNRALTSQEKARRKRAEQHDKDRLEAAKYSVGDFVLVNMAKQRMGSDKISDPLWHGPFEIVEDVGGSGQQYICQEVDNENNKRRVNIHQLKPYTSKPYVAVLHASYQNPQCTLDHVSDHVIDYVFKCHHEWRDE